MRRQILSRIQSYQNFPLGGGSVTIKKQKVEDIGIINRGKYNKYINNTVKENQNNCFKLVSPSHKNYQQFSNSGSTLSSNKKLNGNFNHRKSIKKCLHFEVKQKKNQIHDKNDRTKRMSQKYLSNNNIIKQLNKQIQNENKINQIYHYDINFNKNFNSSGLKDICKNRRKQLMKIYSKYQQNKGIKNNVQSQQNIRNNQQFYSKDHYHNIMMKTVNAFKDHQQFPYFIFPNKKFKIKSPHKTIPTKSFTKIPTQLITEKDDVSIQISRDEEEGFQPSPTVNTQNLQFGCSSIKEANIDNDSSFLEASQKVIIGQLEKICQKQKTSKRKWKKLPNDFLKS